MNPRSAVLERTFTQQEFDQFATLSGDDNPIHVDPGFAATTRFGRTVAHGLFLATVMHGLADQLTPGSRLVSQSLMFTAPTFADEVMRFTAELDEKTMPATITVTAVRVHDDTVTCTATMVFEDYDD